MLYNNKYNWLTHICKKNMTQAILQNIIDQLKNLEAEELHQLNQAIKQHMTVKTQTDTETAFEQALLESGLVEEIKKPTYRNVTTEQLIKVEGKPLSETIIEERRAQRGLFH